MALFILEALTDMVIEPNEHPAGRRAAADGLDLVAMRSRGTVALGHMIDRLRIIMSHNECATDVRWAAADALINTVQHVSDQSVVTRVCTDAGRVVARNDGTCWSVRLMAARVMGVAAQATHDFHSLLSIIVSTYDLGKRSAIATQECRLPLTLAFGEVGHMVSEPSVRAAMVTMLQQGSHPADSHPFLRSAVASSLVRMIRSVDSEDLLMSVFDTIKQLAIAGKEDPYVHRDAICALGACASKSHSDALRREAWDIVVHRFMSQRAELEMPEASLKAIGDLLGPGIPRSEVKQVVDSLNDLLKSCLLYTSDAADE